jgi:hypothetical protein
MILREGRTISLEKLDFPEFSTLHLAQTLCYGFCCICQETKMKKKTPNGGKWGLSNCFCFVM